MKKKILIDLSALKDPFCGLGQVALNYGKYFQEKSNTTDLNYEITLLLPKKMFGSFGDKVKYISSTNLFLKHFKFLFPKFHIWHATHQLSRFMPIYDDTKFLLTIHDLNYLYEKKGKRKMRKHGQLQFKVNRADEIVCISEFAKLEVEQHLNLQGKQCKVIYNGVELLDELAAEEPKNIIKPFFFSVGVIQKKKNFHVLLDMMKKMPEKHLYIAGKEISKPKNNGYAEMIKARISAEGITNVTLLGAISHQKKIWLFKNCEAFMFPSLFEGFGLPVIEAMQFGKPVFSSTETSLKEIGDKFAFFWENFDPQQMKTTVETNLENFYKNEDLIQQEKEYANSFSYQKHFEAYERVYAKL